MKIVLSIFLIYSQLLFCQEKEKVAIFFEQNKTKECLCFNTKTKKETVFSYQDKRYRKLNVTRYLLCRNFFVFDLNKQKFKTLTEEQFSTTQFVDLTYLMKKSKENLGKTLNDLFEIVIIEKALNGGYVQYNVVWEKEL